MDESHETLCFTCGQPAGEEPRLNCLPGGQVCPTCRDRLLEQLPPCLPGQGTALEEFYAGIEGEELVETADGPARLEGCRGPGQLLQGQPDYDDEPA